MIDELLTNLPNQVNNKVEGRVLVVDGDTFCYRASATSKKLSTAIRKFQVSVLEQMFMTKAQTARVHLTHRDCLKTGRMNIKGWKSYQANRTGTVKPPLLDELREAVTRSENLLEEYTCTLHEIVEADDACTIDSYALKDDSVVFSEDKDLRQTIYPFYDHYLGRVIKAEGVGGLWLHVTPAGNTAVHGIGKLFLWFQMLAGDTADNVRGLDKYEGKNIGHIRAFNLLEPYNNTDDESEVANLVLDGYREHDQNPLPEGYLMHMQRHWQDSFYLVLQELELTKRNQEFINECLTREWFTT